MTDAMDRHWKLPDHVPSDQYPLWAVERVWAHLWAQCQRSSDRVELSDACKIVGEIMEPMRRQVEEQGVDGFDAFLARHRQPAPEYGPHTPQPNLSESEAENWWSSKTPRERYAALSGAQPDSYHEIHDTVLIGFGKMDDRVAVVSVSMDWEDIDNNNRTKLLSNMRKGWVSLPEAIRPC